MSNLSSSDQTCLGRDDDVEVRDRMRVGWVILSRGGQVVPGMSALFFFGLLLLFLPYDYLG